MTFTEARKKLKEKNIQEYHTIKYQETMFQDGCIKCQCNIYTERLGHIERETWEEVFAQLNKPRSINYSDQAPEEDIVSNP